MYRIFLLLPLIFALLLVYTATQSPVFGADIDTLELCRVLTQEERNHLKRHPIICDALDVVNRMSLYTEEHPNNLRCGMLKDITKTLLEIGDKEAAKAALRLTHKSFIDMPVMGQYHDATRFFEDIDRFYGDGGQASLLSADDFYPQEFLDDLLVRCNDDFTGKMYSTVHFDGNERFRWSVEAVVGCMTRQSGGEQTDILLEKGLLFTTKVPQNKTCEGMRKDLFFRLFREFPIDKAETLVASLTDADTKKEFTGYLEELRESQARAGIRSDLKLDGRDRVSDLPTREELQTLAESTENIFERCEAKLVLVMFDLEHGNIEQAVKQARELEEIYAGVEERHWGLGGTEKFFSKLAKKLLQEEKYDEGIDYLIEGAGNFVVGQNINWSVDSTWLHEPFIVPPLRELYTAVQTEPARTAIRKKLQSLLEKVKDFKSNISAECSDFFQNCSLCILIIGV